MRGSRQTRKTARGYCSRKEPDEDPKRREKKKKGRSDHTCMLESVRVWRQRRKGSRTMPGVVPAAMLTGCWKIRHKHAPMFHWRSEGNIPVPLSPSVPTGKGKAENCKSMLEAVAEVSAWQAVWEVRLLPLHPAANAEAGCHSELLSRVWSPLPQAAESQPSTWCPVLSLFSLHPDQQIPLGIRKSFRHGLLVGQHRRKGSLGDWGPTSPGPIQNETGNQLSITHWGVGSLTLRTGTCASCLLQDAPGPGPALKHSQHQINTGRVSKALS